MIARPTQKASSLFSPRTSQRRGFSLLLVMFVLTLVGVTLLTLGCHFTQTARYAQSARLEAQAAQILQSGLAWARLHPSELSAAGNAPILLDAQSLAGPAGHATLSWSRDVGKNGWQLTLCLEQGRQKLVRSVIFHPPSPESKGADSR